jgi:hypothetical protein
MNDSSPITHHASRITNNAVLIVGAGIGGMAAAMHLADAPLGAGHDVHLLDAAPAIGGSMHLLDHTFPTNSCGICLMLPHQPAYCPTFECEVREGVRLLPYAEVVGVREVGSREVGSREMGHLGNGEPNSPILQSPNSPISKLPSATKPATSTPRNAPAAATARPSAPRPGRTTTRAGSTR